MRHHKYLNRKTELEIYHHTPKLIKKEIVILKRDASVGFDSKCRHYFRSLKRPYIDLSLWDNNELTLEKMLSSTIIEITIEYCRDYTFDGLISVSDVYLFGLKGNTYSRVKPMDPPTATLFYLDMFYNED